MLARAAVSSLVLVSDPAAQSVAPNYWKWAAAAHQALAAALLAHEGPGIRELASTVAANPRDGAACITLARMLEAVLAETSGSPLLSRLSARLVELAQEVESSSRLLVQFVDFDSRDESAEEKQAAAPTVRALLDTMARRPHHGEHPVDAAIVIPFRAPAPGASSSSGSQSNTDQAGDRVRNLAAVLNALGNQSYPREKYRIVVVESDGEARWRDLFAGACDRYIFAPCPGPFNKCWTVNVGVVHGARPAELLCVLDGDILVDHDFVQRAVERFQECGTQAHWPYRDILFLDEHASIRASRRRCLERADRVDPADLRGVYLRRPPGGCVWLRESLFRKLAGMDERFAGWGGEDEDFVWRIERHGIMDRYDDPLVHLHHGRAPHKTKTGVSFYDETEVFAFCTWPFDSEIGQLDRYTRRAKVNPK